MSDRRTALIAGSTGLVGRELSSLVCQSPAYTALHVLGRRPGAVRHEKVSEHVVSFDALPALPRVDDVFIALGTTIEQAGSEQAFRRVDYDYVLGVARAALAAGATRLGVVSALGADPGSRIFYNRVKGEMERDVSELGYGTIVLAQPSLLLGDREALGQPARAGERWARRLLGPVAALIPAGFRPVPARTVAAALLGAVNEGRPGVQRLPSRRLFEA